MHPKNRQNRIIYAGCYSMLRAYYAERVEEGEFFNWRNSVIGNPSSAWLYWAATISLEQHWSGADKKVYRVKGDE